MDHPKVPEPLRQIAPEDACPVALQHRLDKQTIIPGCAPDMSIPTGQPILDALPRVIPQSITSFHRPSASYLSTTCRDHYFNALMSRHSAESSIDDTL